MKSSLPLVKIHVCAGASLRLISFKHALNGIDGDRTGQGMVIAIRNGTGQDFFLKATGRDKT